MNKIFAILLIISAVASFASAPRPYPYQYLVSRPTVLTTEQTEIKLPSKVVAIHTTIVNRGAGTLYIKFADGEINTQSDFYLLSGESLQNIDVPWNTLELLAVTQSAEVEILVTY